MKKSTKKAKKKVIGKSKKQTSQTRYFLYGIVFFMCFMLAFIILNTFLKPVLP